MTPLIRLILGVSLTLIVSSSAFAQDIQLVPLPQVYQFAPVAPPPPSHWPTVTSCAYEFVDHSQCAVWRTTSLLWPSLALIGAQGLDVWSTHTALGSGRGYEANGLMAGSETRRIALKALTTTGALYLLSKVEPSHPRMTKIVTYGLAGAMGAVAVHNALVMR